MYFEVSVKNVESMEGTHAADGLYEYAPYLIFLEELFLLFMVDNLLIKVTIICILHYYAKS